MTSARPTRCYLGLGSNLGNRLANLQDALRRLPPAVRVAAVSPLYESDPLGPANQPPYFNAVCAGETELSAAALLAAVKAIEWALGRRPGPRWGPRPIDIDILLFGDQSLRSPALTLPHPALLERSFVLTPLAALAPGLILADGRAVSVLAEQAGAEGLRQIAGVEWVTATDLQRSRPSPLPD